MIRYKCPTCQSTLESPPEKAGSKLACPKCQQRIQVPADPRNRTVLGAAIPSSATRFPSPEPQPVQQPQPALAAIPAALPGQTVVVSCPSCAVQMSRPNALAGQWLRCPSCSAMFLDTSHAAKPPMATVIRASPPPKSPPPKSPPPVWQESETPSENLDVSPVTYPEIQRKAVSAKAWRMSSPSMLAFSLLMFCLPWIEIRCNTHEPVWGSKALLKQSGLQSAYGGLSLNEVLESAIAETTRRTAEVMGPVDLVKLKEEANRRKLSPGLAPMMLLYPLVLAVGIFASIGVRHQRLRVKVIGVAASVGVALMIAQAAVGFPLEGALAKAMTRKFADSGGQGDFSEAILAALIFDTHYTPWFWLAMFATIGAGAAAIAEWQFGRVAQEAG